VSKRRDLFSPASNRDESASLASGTPLNSRETYRELNLVVETLSIDRIKPNPGNPRKHDATQIKQIASSIEAFGVVFPLLITPDGLLIAGHAVLEATKQLGYQEVPVVRVPHSEPERRALALTLNRLAEKAEWDPTLLKAEFEALLEFDANFDLSFDPEVTGFSWAEIDQAIETNADPDGEGLDDISGLEGGPAVFQYGNIFLAGAHRILAGDARLTADFAALMQGEKAHFVCADGPYNVKISGHASGLGRHKHREFPCASGEMEDEEFIEFLSTVFGNCCEVSVAPSLHIHFGDWRGMYPMQVAGRKIYTELTNVLVWVKPNGGMGSHWRSRHELLYSWKHGTGSPFNSVQLGKFGRNRTNVLEYPGGSSFHSGREEELGFHPTPKPVALIADLIRDCTTRGQIVLDPFYGSGSTLIAATKTGRRAYVMDLDGGYVDLAVRRWQQWSGEKARHAQSGMSFDELCSKRSAEGSRAEATTEQPKTPPVARVRTRLRHA
jgi:DNA modification methylase